MIGKKIGNPSKSSSKASRAGGLLDYIDAPEKSNKLEKCVYSNARNFLTETHEGIKAEMIALSQEAVKSKDPINHYVLSWREGEQPTPQQAEQAVDIVLDELGLKEHQVFYGLHADTDNLHLHIAVNRVHPETLKVIKPNKGFDIESMHKAVARIEHAQGWQREKNGRYTVLENGDLARANSDKQSRNVGAKQRDMELHTGEKSAQRIAIENGAAIIKEAKSWAELHQQLASKNMRYERIGSGAMVYVGEIGIKASDVDRSAGFSKMQKRLGPYEPATQEKPNVYFTHTAEPHLGKPRNLSEHGLHNLSERRLAHHGTPEIESVLSHNARAYRREPEGVRREPNAADRIIGPHSPQPSQPIKQNVPGWNEFINGRKAHYAAKNVDTLAQAVRQETERKALSGSQKVQRADLLKGDWKGRGPLLNAMRSVIAAQQASEKADLQERHKRERKQMREQYRPYPTLEQWQRQRQRPELAEQWRHRDSEPQQIHGDQAEPPTARDIRAYAAEIVGHQVHYTRKDEAGRGGGVSAFVDNGKSIDIYDWRNRDATLAALQLSAQKWGSFQVTGNDEYKAMCVKLAAEHGFKISNPELQQRIADERDQIAQERAQAMKSEQLRGFEQYSEAVGAERYRVTSIKMREDGSKQTFILDKTEGVTKGFTPDEIAQRTPEMQRLQRRGENIYYTPLSDNKHHILIDDMNRAKLDKLNQDGYQPAAVLESSPGNYQAIITVPKLGTAHDKDVGNRLAERLNQEYGDPKLSGCIHPHRAPGYENRKPKHQREDGSYPEVKLLKAEKRECEKTLNLSRDIDAEYQKLQQAQQKERQPKAVMKIDAPAGSVAQAYQKHHEDVISRQRGGAVDLSRVDAMIAVRMRVTGHQQGEIESALRQCAPATSPDEQGRDWNDYAQRTARYAFGGAGDRQAADLGKYRQQWEKLEGREQKPQIEIAQPKKEKEVVVEVKRDRGPSLGR
jgi:hypothetical protein